MKPYPNIFYNTKVKWALFQHYSYNWSPYKSTKKNFLKMDLFGASEALLLVDRYKPWWMFKYRFIRFLYDNKPTKTNVVKLLMLKYKFHPIKPSLREVIDKLDNQ